MLRFSLTVIKIVNRKQNVNKIKNFLDIMHTHVDDFLDVPSID